TRFLRIARLGNRVTTVHRMSGEKALRLSIAGKARIKSPKPASCTRTPRVQPRKYSSGSTCVLIEVGDPYVARKVPTQTNQAHKHYCQCRSSHRPTLHTHPLPDLQGQEGVDLVLQIPPVRLVLFQQPSDIGILDISSLTDGFLGEKLVHHLLQISV